MPIHDLVIFDDSNELYNKPSDTRIPQLRLSNKIENIKKIYKISKSGSSTGGTELLNKVIQRYPLFDAIDTFYSNAGHGFNEYSFSTMQYIENIRQTFLIEQVFSFNQETKMLYFNGADIRYGDTLIMLATVRENEEMLYEDELFRKMVLANTLRQWINNLSLKYNQEDANVIGNGLKLNISAMKEWAERLEDDIEEGIAESQYNMVIGVTRLYS